ncbi:MAG: hypothetical protein JXB48_14320 [Candidatus Latescibacteria bacterium]|nr:hypothetical protein [Candidatus Latescibacterota bacterium]
MFGVGPIEMFVILITFFAMLIIPVTGIVYLALLYRKISNIEKILRDSENNTKYKYV